MSTQIDGRKNKGLVRRTEKGRESVKKGDDGERKKNNLGKKELKRRESWI